MTAHRESRAGICPAIALLGHGGMPWAYPPSQRCLDRGAAPPDWRAESLLVALERRHASDTWFQGLTATTIEWPRFAKRILVELDASWEGAEPVLSYAVLDLDRPDHRSDPWTSSEEAAKALDATLQQLHDAGWPDAAGYATRGGLRILWRLAEPVPLVHAQSFLDQLHDALPDGLPVSVDEGVKDWTRGYRMPWCPRKDGKAPAWGAAAPPMNLDALRSGRALTWRPAELADETIPPPRTVTWPPRPPAETPADKRIRPCVEKWAQEIAEASSRHAVLLAKCRALGGLCQGGIDRGLGTTPEPWVELLVAAAGDSNDAGDAAWDAVNFGAGSPWWFEERDPPRSSNREGGIGPMPPDPPDLDEPDVATLAWFDRTDLGNAKRLHARFGGDLRWCEARGSWLAWTGTHWEWDERRRAHHLAQRTVELLQLEVQYFQDQLAAAPDEDEDLRKKTADRVKSAVAHALRSQGARAIAAAHGEARALHGMSVRLDELDSHPMLLTLANGTLDLNSGDLRPARREDLTTRALAVSYDPSATCPRWDAFVTQVLPVVEVRELVQRALGYALTGKNTEQRWFLFVGDGSNGKSTLLDVFLSILGSYATRLPPRLLEEQRFEQHPTELMSLLGARFAVGSEPRKGAKWDAERIKALTGDGSIRARAMRQDDVEFPCTAKPFVSANELPRTDDIGHGFWRRLVMVLFTVKVEGDAVDPDLLSKLLAEAPGILNWALAGLRSWQTIGLSVPAACIAETRKYQAEQDSVARFVGERCERDSRFSVRTDVLYQAFRTWLEGEGLPGPPPSKVAFGKGLSRLGFLSFENRRRQAVRGGLTLKGDDPAQGEGDSWTETAES